MEVRCLFSWRVLWARDLSRRGAECLWELFRWKGLGAGSGVCSCHKRGLRVSSATGSRVPGHEQGARRLAASQGHAPSAPGPARATRRLARSGQARGGRSPQGLGSHRGVRMGPGVPPMGGCMYSCWGERPLSDIPADGTLVSVSKIVWKVVGSSRRKFDPANMWSAPIWEMENQDIPAHRTGKVASLLRSIGDDLRRPPFPRAVSL